LKANGNRKEGGEKMSGMGLNSNCRDDAPQRYGDRKYEINGEHRDGKMVWVMTDMELTEMRNCDKWVVIRKTVLNSLDPLTKMYSGVIAPTMH
jgi:hypothetical protein